MDLVPRITDGGRVTGEGRIEGPDFEDAFDLAVTGILDRSKR